MKTGSFNSNNNVIKKHGTFLFFFVFLVIYHIFVVMRLQFKPINDLVYSYYCVDFSFGFATKLLPGAFFNTLFGSHANRTTATVFAWILLILAFMGISVLAERFIHRMPKKKRRATFLLLLFFVSGAYTFAIFGKWLGMMETYWILSAVLFFLFLEHKVLRFFIPLLYCFALLIHFSALIFVVPTFSIILLYRLAVETEKKEKKFYGVIFALSVVLTLAVFFALAPKESQLVVPMEQFHKKLKERGVTDSSYFDYSFFYIWKGESFIPSFVRQVESPLLKFFYIVYYVLTGNLGLTLLDTKYAVVTSLCGIVVLLPILVLFYKTYFAMFRQKGKGLKRFCALLMMVLFPFVAVIGLLFATSVDMTRYYTFAFLGTFVCLLSVLRFEQEQRESFFERFLLWQNSPAMRVYLLAYFAIVLAPCY